MNTDNADRISGISMIVGATIFASSLFGSNISSTRIVIGSSIFAFGIVMELYSNHQQKLIHSK